MDSSTFEKLPLDLRAPVSAKLPHGISNTWVRSIILVLGDLVFLRLALVIAGSYGNDVRSYWEIGKSNASLVVVLGLEVALIAAQGLYGAGEKRCDYLNLMKTLTFAYILLPIIAFLSNPNQLTSRSNYLLSWLLSLLLVCAGRFSIDLLLKLVRKQGLACHHTILICPPEDTEKAYKLLDRQKCYKSIELIDASSLVLEKENIKVLIEAIRYLGVSEIFVCSWTNLKDRMFLYWSLRNEGIVLRILSLDLEAFYRKSEILMLGSIPTIKFSPPLITGFDFWAKRCFDFVVSATLLILIFPLLVVIAITIKLDSTGPFFYQQERVGLKGRRFKVLKFRTMYTNADQLIKELEARNEMKDGILFKMKDDPRITNTGKFLRRTSLDELPQLFNVLLGEMSLVGPRPLPIRDVEKFSAHHFIRHEVLPGITGLWQVSGRSNITSFEEVLRLDTFYIENWSIWLDLQILLRTVAVLLQKKGAY